MNESFISILISQLQEALDVPSRQSLYPWRAPFVDVSLLRIKIQSMHEKSEKL